jgi:hypothetical protein
MPKFAARASIDQTNGKLNLSFVTNHKLSKIALLGDVLFVFLLVNKPQICIVLFFE